MHAIGKTFITGIASSYREDCYDESILGSHLSKKEFEVLMKDMNRVLTTYWPCQFCIWFGYLLSPFTLGFSFFLPNLCISDAKHGFVSAIERQNRVSLRDKGLRLTYVQGFSMSWLELEVMEAVGTDNRPDIEKTAVEKDVP